MKSTVRGSHLTVFLTWTKQGTNRSYSVPSTPEQAVTATHDEQATSDTL